MTTVKSEHWSDFPKYWTCNWLSNKSSIKLFNSLQLRRQIMAVHLPCVSLEQRVSSKRSWYCTLVRCPSRVGSRCKTYLASLLTSSKNPNQSQEPCKVALPRLQNVRVGGYGTALWLQPLLYHLQQSARLAFQKAHLSTFWCLGR